MVKCLTSARFNMRADILRQAYDTGTELNIVDTKGEWVNQQHPDSGEIIRRWIPVDQGADATPADLEQKTFRCLARGIIDGGIRTVGTGESFGKLYESTDYVKLTFPAGVRMSRRDRVTNISDNRGNVLWLEEESYDSSGGHPPTIFEVIGITPIIDPFGRHTESFALLERAEDQ